jgi:hypothetical protein
MRLPLAAACLAAACLAAGAKPVAAEPAKGVVELFTSQGCSSCPPADKVLADLAKVPGVVTLSLPIDYWDYIGWKDTLATPANTQRQKGYALGRGDGQVYTPQAVVNGVTHIVGSERAAIDGALSTSIARNGAMTVPVDLTITDGKIAIAVGATDTPRKASVWLIETIPSKTIAIGRGENRGRELTYTSVVRKMTKIGDWTGTPMHYDQMARLDAEAYVVLLQAEGDKGPGPILGAAKSPVVVKAADKTN